ncbi:hypothetical protein EPUS_04081 [Endocarpon pusillum Z07020]|uniref:HAUS augmin-like complex subunit 1 n=1 Tax=Endocarpon pusillum (strain Z07020 / HMAS-L-300199) TaxID=1263415 RepID=U1GMG6_ENDPU|nr:uncharacterized protein EPUS_04081 [Endocarpon pusillum Z07020]ERF73458.1 hypothetical protein EPUS_04081 [Endocarpon pusillum Z07020]
MSNLSLPFAPLLSPTKARRDAAEARDWAYVSSWLAKKYSPHPVPKFERNGETLRTLLELAAVNEAADREADLVHKAEEEELRTYENIFQTREGPHRDVVEALEGGLDERGSKALHDLAEASVILGTLSTDPVMMGKRIMELSHEKFEMNEQLRRVNDLQSQLVREMESMRLDLENIESQVDEVAQEDMEQRTAQLNRETKQFSTKLEQYIERIASLEKFAIVSPSIAEVREQEQRVKKGQARVKALDRKIAEFHGLPPDLEIAKMEYKRAQGELQGLTRRRDELFEGMVES